MGLTRWAVDWWNKKDIFQFRERINAAHLDHGERWEEQMDSRLENPEGNRGSDVLLMSKLRAEQPAKYREQREGQPDAAAPRVTQINIHLPPGVVPPGEPTTLVVEGAAKLVPDEEDGLEVAEGDQG